MNQENLVTVLLLLLVVLPIPTSLSAVYLWSLYRKARPSLLAFLLAFDTTVGLICGLWLAAVTFLARFLHVVIPNETAPLTILAIVLPLVMVNVVAFLLWRSGFGHQ